MALDRVTHFHPDLNLKVGDMDYRSTVWAIWTLTVRYVRKVGKMFLEVGKFMRIVTGDPAGRVQGQQQGQAVAGA